MTIEIPMNELRIIESALLYKTRALTSALGKAESMEQRNQLQNELNKATRVLHQLAEIIAC